ncbi:cytochrome P450 [Alicyclobacillus fodiniaquatilis]|uniref:Cytochrome P450 n=1 Tax=Alicyclobacillus fodiniaquatilis TaxID=1661150 RepID=A0ABW4JIL6_9BACL
MTEHTFVFNPMSPEFQEDRHAVLKLMRESYPLYSEPDQHISGRPFTRWTLTTYDDTLFVLRDHRFVRELRNALPAEKVPSVPDSIRSLSESQQNTMLFRDPPDHTRLRSLINKAFTPRIIRHLEPRIHDIAKHLLNEFEQGTKLDIVRSFAFPLPVIVIAELLGVPVEDRELFKEWSNAFVRTLDIRPSMETLLHGNQVTIDFREYFRNIVRERTKHPKEDLISELIHVRESGDRLSEDELLDMCILILMAGHETTVNLIANAIYLMTQHPDQQLLLRNHQGLMKSAVEEVLRFESPVQVTGRTVKEDFEYNGQLLSRGDFVNVWISAANRDPKVFNNPDTFDITRQNNRHLAFGQGIHYCLGAPLARQEGAIALSSLINKFSSLNLSTSQVQWIPSLLMRSLKELVIEI